GGLRDVVPGLDDGGNSHLGRLAPEALKRAEFASGFRVHAPTRAPQNDSKRKTPVTPPAASARARSRRGAFPGTAAARASRPASPSAHPPQSLVRRSRSRTGRRSARGNTATRNRSG